MIEARISRTNSHIIEETEWGRLMWMVSGAIGNSTVMTVGRCYIEPGHANPRHYHPNSDEVLHVLQGTIRHSLNDETTTMSAGDTISIPKRAVHNAENIGADEAIFVIAFDTPDRQAIGEEST